MTDGSGRGGRFCSLSSWMDKIMETPSQWNAASQLQWITFINGGRTAGLCFRISCNKLSVFATDIFYSVLVAGLYAETPGGANHVFCHALCGGPISGQQTHTHTHTNTRTGPSLLFDASPFSPVLINNLMDSCVSGQHQQAGVSPGLRVFICARRWRKWSCIEKKKKNIQHTHTHTHIFWQCVNIWAYTVNSYR